MRYSNGVRSEKYICWTRKQMRYMLGDHGYSYVVGSSPPNRPGQFPKRVHNRGASCPAPPANCSQVTALYNPQDNPHTIEGALVLVSPPAAAVLLETVLGSTLDLLRQCGLASALCLLTFQQCRQQPDATARLLVPLPRSNCSATCVKSGAALHMCCQAVC